METNELLVREQLKRQKRILSLIAKTKRGSAFSSFLRYRPSLSILFIFLFITISFAFLLSLPISNNYNNFTSFDKAFFTSSSAISGTGLTVLPSDTYWSFFGQVILLILIQVGGLGVMTIASMVAFMASKRLGLTTKILASSDIKASNSKFGELGSLIRTIFITMVSFEVVITLLLLRKFYDLHEGFWQSLWHAIFFSVSSFNNAGFNISPAPFNALSGQWGIVIPVLISTFMGSIGFPVILNISSAIKRRSFNIVSLHSKVVIIMFFSLNFLIIIWFFAVEWNNHALFSNDILNNDLAHSSALTFAALTTQTSGFGVIDANNLSETSRMITQIWMFIGGAPASTCSGIKVTTVAVLLLAVFAEFHGTADVTLFKKRFSGGALKMAVTIFICSIAVVLVFSIIIDLLTDAPFQVVQFDVISAFANSGLSLGLSKYLNPISSVLIGALMIIGRLGTMTIISAMFRENRIIYTKYPEENIIIA